VDDMMHDDAKRKRTNNSNRDTTRGRYRWPASAAKQGKALLSFFYLFSVLFSDLN
jgi:hypothetical protein